MKARLIELTENLLFFTRDMKKQFDQTRENGKDGDFFTEVKPFSDKVKEINDQWMVEAIQWVKEEKPKNFHSNQVDSAHEQIEQISIQSFFVKTSKSRFIQTSTSIEYVLNLILSYAEKGEKGCL
ncbi:MAG: YppE family protein [Bacillota bacterium]|nr:YppE family protein [Bacillota bacterium]